MTVPNRVGERLAAAERVRLFLDYDGTLADFAPTPEHVNPDPEVIDLLARLAGLPRFRVSVVSGRRLGHVEKLVPVAGVLLAGTYGVELRLPDGERVDRVSYESVRPSLEAVKPRWAVLIDGRKGFFLEDKGWALALHARFAEESAAEDVLMTARSVVDEVPSDLFRVLSGHRFLEIGPRLAHKGRTVDHLLACYPWPGALPVYLGDDDKDEEAFGAVKAHGGIAILVSRGPRETRADGRLESPQTAHRWLKHFLTRRLSSGFWRPLSRAF
jgi:trehalose 6-phosphate phosphatase